MLPHIDTLKKSSNIKYSFEDIKEMCLHSTISLENFNVEYYPTAQHFLDDIAKIFLTYNCSDGTTIYNYKSTLHIFQVCLHYYPEITFEQLWLTLLSNDNVGGLFCNDIHRYTIYFLGQNYHMHYIANITDSTFSDVEMINEYGWKLSDIVKHLNFKSSNKARFDRMKFALC